MGNCNQGMLILYKEFELRKKTVDAICRASKKKQADEETGKIMMYCICSLCRLLIANVQRVRVLSKSEKYEMPANTQSISVLTLVFLVPVRTLKPTDSKFANFEFTCFT